ncbi:MAG: esterase [Gammaproteobacteria bacterium]|nr:esterase [Gammaproteobacteria bacterium]
MTQTTTLHPFGDVFRAAAVTPETAEFNLRAARMMQGRPGIWDIGVEVARGGGFMPPMPRSARAIDRTIDGNIGVHIVPAESPRAVYLHLHGGGMILGSAAGQDPMLERIAREVGVTCVSVEYRLAPEHPFPAAWDDCEAVALWLARNAKAEFGTDTLLIGGESAGAMLAVPTLTRMRDRQGYRGFRGANLSFGVYDSSMTPSQRKADSGVLKASDIARIAATYCPDPQQMRHPDISSLYGSLHELPPALFTVGTLDAFLDDSLFMYCRWLSSGNRAEIAIWPGADHAFIETPHPLAAVANQRIDAFLRGCLA